MLAGVESVGFFLRAHAHGDEHRHDQRGDGGADHRPERDDGKTGKLAEQRGYEGVGTDVIGETDKAEAMAKDYVFEPSPEKVLDTLLPLYINFQIYQMILESRASEHSARMVSMKSATDNAESMIKDLTLDYNKMRQAAITSELLEITTAMKAME